jgi:hypothetical protein
MKFYSRKQHHCQRAPVPVLNDRGRVTVKKISRMNRQVEKAVCMAKVNRDEPLLPLNLLPPSDPNPSVNFPNFDFHLAATKCIRPKPPPTTITWEDDIPKSGGSQDNVTLIYYLPKFTPRNTLVSHPGPLRFNNPLLIPYTGTPERVPTWHGEN